MYQPQVSSCYYHPERGAVAVCSKCGVGICRECLVRDDAGRILCYQCGNEQLRQKHRERKEQIKASGGRFRKGTDFILPTIAGILILIVGGIIDYYMHLFGFPLGNILWLISHRSTMDSAYFISDMWQSLVSLVGVSYFLLTIPYGYILLGDWFAPKYNSAFSLGVWSVKLCVAIMIGCFAFPFFLIRFIIRKIMSKKDGTEGAGQTKQT